MEPTVYLNGAFLPADEARISPLDRGFLFADGVYEVLRFYSGRLFLLPEHLDRLRHSLSEISLEADPEPDWEGIFTGLLEANDLSTGDGLIYLQVTRGVAPRSHAFPEPPVQPTIYAFADRRPRGERSAGHAEGVGVITHPDERWGRCDIKSVALLPNILASQAAAAAGAREALLLRDQVVTEGSHSSLFAVFNGLVYTHPLGRGLLPGITRNFLCRLLPERGVAVREEAVSRNGLFSAEELFLTGTGSEITPIVAVDDRMIGSGTPGPLTREIQRIFAEIIRKHRNGEGL